MGDYVFIMIDLNKEKLNIKDKKITLYKSTDKNAPLIVFNTFEGDGEDVYQLFAVYATYKTDVFDRVASMSGSLWFSNFIEYCKGNEYKRLPDKIYFSLGDKEANTRNPVLKTVQDKTIELSEYFKILGTEVIFELNPGNHFTDTIFRSAKGIKAIL